MEISSQTTENLKKHLEEIAIEQATRRNNGTRGDHDYLSVMSDESLRDHQLYILREVTRRDAGPRYYATFTK
ncbi:hypothetical protein GCM10011374_38640 [Kocuria dechangensis]|uniref:Uncharacterized protein n=1 Tax=Kocuria dechangensis TaxID=1176249 RepID=A0A917M1E6_9MICC|nr:hypothetical protein [Kocuria dechangensis]GGG70376.1 hypothetical protein GCM10011374_38640 [Kocuria dechangensis]